MPQQVVQQYDEQEQLHYQVYSNELDGSGNVRITLPAQNSLTYWKVDHISASSDTSGDISFESPVGTQIQVVTMTNGHYEVDTPGYDGIIAQNGKDLVIKMPTTAKGFLNIRATAKAVNSFNQGLGQPIK